MDPKKQLAQRLYLTPGRRLTPISKSFGKRPSESVDNKRPLNTLAPKMNSSVRPSKQVKLDPISPHIKHKITAKLPAEEKSANNSFVQEKKSTLGTKSKLRRESLPASDGRSSKKSLKIDKGTSPFEILHLIRFDPELADDFWYLNKKGDQYEFEFVNFENRDPDNYLTISSRGVTYFKNGESEFLTLEEWDREHTLYQRLKTINFFKQYKAWKNFSLWKNIRRRNMIKERANFLKNQLFFLDDTLRDPLLSMRTQTYRIMKSDIMDLSTEDVRTLDTFYSSQSQKRQELASKLEEIETTIKELVSSACNRSMEEFQKQNRTTIQNKDESEDNKEPFLIGDETNKQMPYTQEAIIRTHYSKLSKYIKLCDYMIIDSKLALSLNSVLKVLEIFTAHEGEEKARKKLLPLLVINSNFEKFEILFDPSVDAIKECLEDGVLEGITVVCNNELLISSPEFRTYKHLLEKYEEMDFEDDIDLLQMAINDGEIRKIDEQIKSAVDRAFAKVVEYSKVFMPQLEIYNENENLDLEYYRTAELEEFKNAIEKYREQIKEFSELQQVQKVGIMQLDSKNLKEKLKPNPKECLKKIENLMPELSYERASKLHNELTNANRKLAAIPKTVDEYIEYSKFLKETDSKMAEYSSRFTGVRDLNQLMEAYSIRYDEDTKQKFSDCLQALSNLRQRVDTASSRDDSDKIKFSKELRDKVVAIEKKVKEINEKLADDRISDREAQPGMLVLFLRDVGVAAEQCFEDSKAFAKFQEELEIERTDFEYVNEMRRDFKLKSDMWNALYEWSTKVNQWCNTPFKDIDVDQITKEVDQYYRIALRSRALEEQQNFVPQVLKERVEKLKNTMPAVVDLRSPALQERHWEQIIELLKQKIDISDPSFTLQTLINMKVNDYKDEIADIALKAKKEMELEKQLNEIINSWENVEFQLKHDKDKDIYTLTALDDIITLLDDTQVAITSIMTNRFIAPLYDQVEPWQKKFALFSNTLDEWMNVQKQWLYLENIFSSPDIIKQLPSEQKKFANINEEFQKLMRDVHERPIALQAATKPGLYKQLKDYNSKLELIQKALENYLDKKRKQFPRFFFLSNDELLEILAQAREPRAVQPHLRKIFESIYRLDFGPSEEIFAMFSAEDEKVQLSRNLRARGDVEEWLNVLENDMVKSLKREMKEGFNTYDEGNRPEWVISSIAQVVSCVCNIMWTSNTEEALTSENSIEAMADWYESILSQLEDLTQLVRTDLSSIERRSVVALVTQDVHNRDIVESLKDNEISNVYDFRWQQQLRYYFNTESDECTIKQVNSVLHYGYEYMGATTRLVITPLTDRCWMTITGALGIKLGSSPAGPAGTGKTESVKDLAKALGQYCVVFNCSEQITFKMMETLFLGLCNTGAWSCLDEFNRIDIEVLSVIAQQLRTIKNARWEGKEEFFLDDKQSKLVDTMGVFITMNPGYAGRTELPDNLKVLFRPVSMMVPDYTLIAEIMLFAEGFSEAKNLSGKMTKLYKLSSEQLSQQDHYDFGMRAVKSVLNMAGALKRKDPDLSEEVVLIRAMRDSNVPKFLKEDLVLFYAIVQDLFPGVEVPYVDYGELAQAIKEIINREKLQHEPKFVEKVVQLYETFAVRFGVMIVGPATAGKTTCYKTLASSMTYLRKELKSKNEGFQEVEHKIINPKAINMGELYGEYNEFTQDWKDGLASSIMRNYSEREDKNRRWVVFDGPVDALWIENMNTVLDDNMMLCLANGQRIKLKHEMRMLFEVQDLAVASPATVSRCGMVYMDLEAVGWKAYMTTWVEKNLEEWTEEMRDCLKLLFDKYVEKALHFIRKGLTEPIPTTDMSLVMSCCSLIKSLTDPEVCPRVKDEFEHFKKYLEKIFMFCCMWTVGGALDYSSTLKFENFMTGEFSFDLPKGSLYDSYVSSDKPGGGYIAWEKIKPDFIYDPSMSYFELVVPTKDTVRFSYILNTQIKVQKPVFITGNTGVGKTVIVSDTLYYMKENENSFPVFLTFSAQTSSIQTQNSILSKLDSKRKDMVGGPGGKKVVLMIDDVNMPAVEVYGAQPPIELLRQYCDLNYIYDRGQHFPIQIIDTTLVCCAAPPEGGRNPLTPRFTRHFHVMCIPPTSEDSMNLIFKTILDGFFQIFKPEIQSLSGNIVQATINIYNTISKELLPTPAKSHYTFNLRDLSKVFQGILMGDFRIMTEPESMIRLWIHETSRVFHDRLINDQDKNWFNNQIVRQVGQIFRKDWTHEDIFEGTPVLFGDFMKGDLEAEDRNYEEITNFQKLTDVMYRLLDDYNYSGASTQMNLVFFQDALEHLCRICRILRQPRGNAMLVGVGGCGKQSLTRLAAHICNCRCFQIQITKSYGIGDFREDLKTLFKQAGGPEELPTVFLLSDTQLVVESMLEDINNILNTGEVPSLFQKEELEEIENDLRPIAAERKVFDNMYNFFIQRVRENLHIVLCMSPVGETLRVRMRMFPSLVNCCTIDWVNPWPEDALLSVSRNKMKELQLEVQKEEAERLKEALSQSCVYVHTSVLETAEEFHQALSRKIYITPKSYLDMIALYFQVLENKSAELSKARSKYMLGVETIKVTNEEVYKMQEDLQKLQPELEVKRKEAEELSAVVEKDTIEANKVKEEVEAEEKEVSAQTEEVQKLQQQAQADLDEAIPVLEAATKALDQINPRDIAEIKSFTAPAALIKYTLEAVSILLQEKTDWDSIKKTLQAGFIDRLKNYPKDNIPNTVLSKIRKKIKDNEDFTVEKVGAVNTASKSLCLWIYAIEKYATVSLEVAPKRKKLEEMNSELKEAASKLAVTQAKLQKELDKVADLEAKRQAVLDERDRLNQEAETTRIRLERASVLTGSLQEENLRWQQQAEKLAGQMRNVVGDTFLSAACISYYGPFTGVYRNQLVEGWLNKCTELDISVTPGFDLKDVMVDPMTVREWNIQSLPADTVSINNGVLVTACDRWPLLIDPQEQANRWIKKLEEKNSIKVCKQTEKNFSRVLENCIKNGNPLLVEDIPEKLDAALDPILDKNLIQQGAGRFALRMGDQDIDYDTNFKLYMTTKMRNPHYKPDVSIRTTLINFTVTVEGLEEQLLAAVVSKEQPSIERKKTELLIAMAKDQKSLVNAEDTILSSLTDSKGMILDDPQIIQTLKSSKKLSTEIGERMVTAEENKKEVEAAFKQYESIAVRGSILYFVIADLSEIDPMYQYSLSYFTKLFNQVIDNSKKSKDIHERIQILLNSITEYIYINVCRGLFNAHKLIFSFLITIQILRREEKITDEEWKLFLKGVPMIPKEFTLTPNPDSEKFTDKAWDFVNYLQNVGQDFKDPLLGQEITKNLDKWAEWVSQKEPQNHIVPEPYSEVSYFSKLLLVKAFREEKVIYMINQFVEHYMGKKFVEVPAINTDEVYAESNCKYPIIFILSTGADPMSLMTKLAEENGFLDKMDIISLGKGQGEKARKLIESSSRAGKWVVLQNCHLAKSWMPSLETIVESFEDPKSNINPNFRLLLTSMPRDYFPVPVLQNGIKITNEPPKGIKANVARSLNNLSEEEHESCLKVKEWKKLLFNLTMFHAVIQERRKFGPLGWNIRYEFNESDLETSILMLKNFLDTEEEAIPWDAIKFMTGEINYGGRVTDDWDRRCLMNILKIFICPEALEDNYKFSSSGVFYSPPITNLEGYKDYAESLPLVDEPEIFGMHDNANINFQMQESNLIVSTALSIQPRDTGKGSSGKSPDEVVDELAAKISEELPPLMVESEADPSVFARNKEGLMESLGTFLGQEMVRFNKLLSVMKNSLEELRKAVKGIVVMSDELDMMYSCMLNNKVPGNWEKVAYPSLRPLASWVNDLKERVAFLRKWLAKGKPEAYWLSSFFFPQGFLTAVLQNFSRKYQIPIDILNFSFDFQPFYDITEITEVPDDGCFIYGLYMEGCRWDMQSLQLEDSHVGEMYANAPAIFFSPAENYTPDPEEYAMPVYKTSVRAGTLSTTGHSTNFIIAIDTPTSKLPQYWVLQGAALLCQLND